MTAQPDNSIGFIAGSNVLSGDTQNAYVKPIRNVTTGSSSSYTMCHDLTSK